MKNKVFFQKLNISMGVPLGYYDYKVSPAHRPSQSIIGISPGGLFLINILP